MAVFEVELEDGQVLEVETEDARQQPSMATRALKTLFGPSEVVRQGVGQRVTSDIRRFKDLIESSPVGQLVRAGTAPPTRALFDMTPEAIGETVGTATSAAVDPTTALFGLGGTIRNRLFRTLAGTATGTLGGVGRSVAATEEPDPSTALLAGMIGSALGGLGAAATRVTPRGIRAAPVRDLSARERAQIASAKQSAGTLGSPTGHLFGRRGIIGTARERLGRVEAYLWAYLVIACEL